MQNNNSIRSAGCPEHEADSVLAAFEDALGLTRDTKALLDSWTRRFPALGADFAMAVTDHVAGDPVPAGLTNREDLHEQAVSMVAAYKIPGDAHTKLPPRLKPAATLKECARSAGLSFPAQLALTMRVPPALLERLNNREIDTATVPRPFASDLATALQLSFADCARILRGSSGFAGAVNEARSRYGHPVSFEDALLAGATEDEQAYWSAKTVYAGRLGDEAGETER